MELFDKQSLPEDFDLFLVQPEACRTPLPLKEFKADPYIKRVLLCDPVLFYERCRKIINPFTRYNYVSFDVMFPDCGDLCSCGCGKLVPKRKKKFATQDCERFAIGVWTVISGKQGFPLYALTKYYDTETGVRCAKCGEPFIDLDHIIPIAQGGGGCWLNNYQFLCENCHKAKTALDNNWKKSKHFKKDK